MKVTTSLPTDDLGQVSAAAAQAQAAGFYGVSTQENRHDPFLPLAVAATATSTLELRTSIAIAFGRSPMMTALVAWDLQAASHGRFILGLGSQVKGHNVRRFSVPWSAPAPRLREYVESMRAIWRCWETGERLDYQGEHYQFSLMTPNFTPPKLPCPPPPVHIAAVGPGMLNLAARTCDGVMLHPFCTRRYLEQTIGPRLQRGLAESGRERSQFEISGGGFIATGADDEAVGRTVEWVRSRIGFYGSTPAYWPVFDLHDLRDLGEKLNVLSKQGKWDEMTASVSDDVVHLFCASGRHDGIKAAIAKRFAGVADTVAMDPGVPPDLLQDIRSLS